MKLSKLDKRKRIHKRVRKTVKGTQERPRLAIFRSNKEIYAQLINDVNGTTLVAASSKDKEVAGQKGTKIEKAALVGEKIAKLALDKGFETVTFDRAVSYITDALNHWLKEPEKVD